MLNSLSIRINNCLTGLIFFSVRSFGTEDRPTDRPLPARNEVFEFIIFRGLDIKDLHVCEPPKPQPTEGVPLDPAIVKVFFLTYIVNYVAVDS